MERSIPEQEREIKELVRRATRNLDKQGALRRDALNRLIGLIHSPYPSLKQLAAANIPLFFNDFPELEEAAINAIYDLCEDQSSKVRMDGYQAITQVSKADNKLIKRNADVLLQLLQSDEPEEVLVVKKALTEHVDMDPKVTLSVLCDQIRPADETMDEEEKTIRNRLRMLVLSFLTGEGRRAVFRNASVAGEIIIEGLIQAIPKLEFNEIEIIIKDLLVPLDVFTIHASQGQLLLQSLLLKTAGQLRNDIHSHAASLDATRPYLELLNLLVVGKHIAPSSNLLQFYCSSLTRKTVLQQFTPEIQIWIICNMVDILAALENDTNSQLLAPRRQVVGASPLLLQALCKFGLQDERAKNACIFLLQSCMKRNAEPGGTLPVDLVQQLEKVSAKIQEYVSKDRSQEVQDLIRVRSGPPSPSTVFFSDTISVLFEQSLSPHSNLQIPTRGTGAAEDVSRTKPTPPLGMMINNSHPSPSLPPPNGSSTLQAPLNASKPPQRLDQAPPLSLFGAASSLSASTKRNLQPDSSSRPPKRRRNGEFDDSTSKPSLLSRLELSASSDVSAKRTGPPLPVPSSSAGEARDGPPPGGWSIKGAAGAKIVAHADQGPRRTVSPSLSYSLLNRLGSGDPSFPEGGTTVGDWKRKKRGKM